MGFISSVFGDVLGNMVKSYSECQSCGQYGLTIKCPTCKSSVCLECRKNNMAVFDREKRFKTFVFTCPVCGEQTKQKSMGLGSGV